MIYVKQNNNTITNIHLIINIAAANHPTTIATSLMTIASALMTIIRTLVMVIRRKERRRKKGEGGEKVDKEFGFSGFLD